MFKGTSRAFERTTFKSNRRNEPNYEALTVLLIVVGIPITHDLLDGF
jgi:hypothetical protein